MYNFGPKASEITFLYVIPRYHSLAKSIRSIVEITIFINKTTSITLNSVSKISITTRFDLASRSEFDISNI